MADPVRSLAKAAHRLERLRAIDIETRNVAAALEGCRHIALSYVWDGSQKFQAKEHDFKVHEYGKEYLPLPPELPCSISDASL